MKPNAQAQQEAALGPYVHFSDHADHADQAGPHADNIDRAAQNRADWSTYLPEDCVATMILLGWDRST